MTEIICRRVDLIHVNHVDWIYDNTISLKEGKNFIYLSLTEPATYQSSRSNPDAGPVLTETVTAKVKMSFELNSILKISLKNYILRLYTNDRIFLTGSLDYPTELTFSSDKIFVNLTFKAISPLL